MSAEEAQRRRERLALAAEEAARRVDRAWSGHGARPAEPGDLYAHTASADFPVVWALIDRHPDRPELFLAVPADSGPMLGDADVAVPAESETGPLALRCRSRIWLPESALDPALHVGTLPPETLERAKGILRQLAEKGDLSPEEEGSEYREWMREVIAPARAAVGSFVPTVQPRRSLRSAYAVAASLLIALGLAGWLVQRNRQLGRLQAEHAAAMAALKQERNQRTVAERQREKTEQELQRRIAELTVPPQPREAPLLNLPLAFLDPVGALRGEPQVIRLPPDARFLGLVLYLAEEAESPSYRLTLRRRGGTEVLWRSPRFPAADPGEIRLVLPRRLLSPGEHRLHLEGLDGGKAVPLADYDLEIVP